MADYCFEGARYIVLCYEKDGSLTGVHLSSTMAGAKISKRYHTKPRRGTVARIVPVSVLTELEEADETHS